MPTFDTPEPVSVAIELAVGDARLTAGDRPDTVVEVLPRNPDKKADVKAANDRRSPVPQPISRTLRPGRTMKRM